MTQQPSLHPRMNPEIAQAILDFEKAAKRLQELHEEDTYSLFEFVPTKRHNYYAFSATYFYIDENNDSKHRHCASLTAPDRIMAAVSILSNVLELAESFEMDESPIIANAISSLERMMSNFCALTQSMAIYHESKPSSNI